MLKIHELLSNRRSHYVLDKNIKQELPEVVSLIEDSIFWTPSAFNAQTQRVVVLLGHESDKFWDITENELRKVAPEQGFENTVAKLNSFKQGVGTVLFYIDTETVVDLQTNFPLYADNFPVWAQQENGMAQLVVWSALVEEGLGGSLQHYNPVVDEETAKHFHISTTWQLVAQMPFGNPLDTPDEKPKLEISERVVIKG